MDGKARGLLFLLVPVCAIIVSLSLPWLSPGLRLALLLFFGGIFVLVLGLALWNLVRGRPEAWHVEARDFRDAATTMFTIPAVAFPALRGAVHGAPWPDACTAEPLAQICQSIEKGALAKEDYLTLDRARRTAVDTILVWAPRLSSQGFAAWLFRELDCPYHADTIRLAWYMAAAKAAATHQQGFNSAPFAKVRDVLNARLAHHRDGHET